MDEICFDVEVEPKLQLLQGESFLNKSTTNDVEATLDMKADRLWDLRYSRSVFDVKIFNPQAKISLQFKKTHTNTMSVIKISKYQQKTLNVEQSSFRLLIFACTYQ